MHISEDVIRKVLYRVAQELHQPEAKRVIEIVNGGEGASFDGIRGTVPVSFQWEDVQYTLPEGMADMEEIPEGIRRIYNKALARCGQTDMLLPEHTIQRLVRAHEWLWITAGKPVPAPIKERKKPEPRPETVRDFVWKGQPVTKAQFEQRVRMTKGPIPENCLMPANSGLAEDVAARFSEPVVVQEPKAKKKAKKSSKKEAAQLEKALAVLGIDPKVLASL